MFCYNMATIVLRPFHVCIHENGIQKIPLQTCALKKVYIKKEHGKSKTCALKIKIGF